MKLEVARRLAADDRTWETVVVDEDTGGGPGAVTVIGPYTINHDTPNIATQAKVADLAADTIVIYAWAFVTETWDDGGAMDLGVGASDWAAGNWWTVARYDPQDEGTNPTTGVEPLGPAASTDRAHSAGYTTEPGALIVSCNPVAATQGQAQIYALIYTPA